VGNPIAVATPAPVLVTGSEGRLGRAFLLRLSPLGDCIGVDQGDLDIADERATAHFVRSLRPRLILNCAAYDAVDGAEAAPLDALRTNAATVSTLVGLAADLDAVLVHYGSDFVFDGEGPEPYREDDEPRPRSMYGMSKLVGERCAMTASRLYVVRVSSLWGGHTQRSFVDAIIRQARAGQRVAAFDDRTVSPSCVPDVVDATLALVAGRAAHGLYHCASDG